MKNNINKYLKLALIILLGLALIYFAIKVVIFWLPLIIILIIIYCIYKFFIKKNKQAEDINKELV